MQQMDWSGLRDVLAVARAGNLRRAGEALGLSASALQRRIQRFEAELGIALFLRSSRGYVLTAEGESLVERAEEVEELVLAAQRALLGDASIRGSVRMTLVPSLVGVVAPCLEALLLKHPELSVQLLSTGDRLDIVRDTEIALRITKEPDERSIARKVGEIEWAAYASVPSPKGWLEYERAPAGVRIVRKLGPTLPSSRLSVNGVSAAANVMKMTELAVPLPTYIAEPMVQLGQCQRLGDAVPVAPLWMMVHADLRRSARVRTVAEHLLPHLRVAIDPTT